MTPTWLPPARRRALPPAPAGAEDDEGPFFTPARTFSTAPLEPRAGLLFVAGGGAAEAEDECSGGLHWCVWGSR